MSTPELREQTFHQALCSVLNRFSKENGSNTPDFVLADHVAACLANFDMASKDRERWYGVELRPGDGSQAELRALRADVERKDAALQRVRTCFLQSGELSAGSVLDLVITAALAPAQPPKPTEEDMTHAAAKCACGRPRWPLIPTCGKCDQPPKPEGE